MLVSNFWLQLAYLLDFVIYRRWLQFSRNGLWLSFIWPQMLTGAELFVAAAGGVIGAVTGHWLAATLSSAVAALVIGMLLDRHRRYGGAPVPWRYLWTPVAFFMLAPLLLLSTATRRQLQWRGRVHALDGRAALAEIPPSNHADADLLSRDGWSAAQQ